MTMLQGVKSVWESTPNENPLRRPGRTLWFENSDAYGCHTWDSDYGANYAFTY